MMMVKGQETNCARLSLLPPPSTTGSSSKRNCSVFVRGMTPLARLKQFINPPGDVTTRLRTSILRRQHLLSRLSHLFPYFRSLLIIAGFLYLLALPSHQLLGRGHYVSENALQPSQVNTYWNWADVHIADLYADQVQKWDDQNLTTYARATAIKDAFQALGLPTATQNYSFHTPESIEKWSGVNAYAILQAPKTDGAEALVLGASWLSRAVDQNGERRVNVRGVAIVLALANYLKKYSMWSKDIVFLISDAYVDGSQAWLDSYHGYGQSNLDAEQLSVTTGPIWAALYLDYPHHSFSHVGLYYEGANAHLPNLDFINSASHILKHTGIPVVLHSDHSPTLPSFLPHFAFAEKYLLAARALTYQLALGALGRAPGPEGVFGRYRIDTITFFGIPAEGPHGFHALGRATESMFRSLNNLLERFHQSFFLYLMTSVDTFISVGNYLAAPILVSAGMTITGLMIWSRDVQQSEGQSKGVGQAMAVIGVTHLLGGALFALVTKVDSRIIGPTILAYLISLLLSFTPTTLTTFLQLHYLDSLSPTTPAILHSLTLILSGLLIAIASTLNFGLASLLAIFLCGPMTLARPRPFSNSNSNSNSRPSRAQHLLLTFISPPVLWSMWSLVDSNAATVWWETLRDDWDLVGTHGIVVLWVAVVPLLLQVAVVGLLPRTSSSLSLEGQQAKKDQ